MIQSQLCEMLIVTCLDKTDIYVSVMRNLSLSSYETISVSGAPTAPDLDRNVASGRQNFDVEVELWKIELDVTSAFFLGDYGCFLKCDMTGSSYLP